MKKNYKEILPQISTFIFDVDGVLTDGMVNITENGELLRTMNTKDGYALKCAVDAGYLICIISGGINKGVQDRLEGLGITAIYLGAQHKLEQFYRFIDMNNLLPENILYMGDDIPDYPVMQKVGLACCPKDAVPEILDISAYISQKKGGKGCVRDVIEQVMKVQGKWDGNYNAN